MGVWVEKGALTWSCAAGRCEPKPYFARNQSPKIALRTLGRSGVAGVVAFDENLFNTHYSFLLHGRTLVKWCLMNYGEPLIIPRSDVFLLSVDEASAEFA